MSIFRNQLPYCTICLPVSPITSYLTLNIMIYPSIPPDLVKLLQLHAAV